MGSGPIKGFSVTLGIGIFTTLFSVYFIARLLTSIYVFPKIKKQGRINLMIAFNKYYNHFNLLIRNTNCLFINYY